MSTNITWNKIQQVLTPPCKEKKSISAKDECLQRLFSVFLHEVLYMLQNGKPADNATFMTNAKIGFKTGGCVQVDLPADLLFNNHIFLNHELKKFVTEGVIEIVKWGVFTSTVIKQTVPTKIKLLADYFVLNDVKIALTPEVSNNQDIVVATISPAFTLNHY